jgi:NAD(P)-dependent dehydrogenase (short-subunit alcohol dehydrogenase family)
MVWNQAQREVLPKDLFGTPIQRMGAQEEIAAFVSYVASDNAGFVTGKVDTFL